MREDVKVVLQGANPRCDYVVVSELTSPRPFLAGEDDAPHLVDVLPRRVEIPIMPWRCYCGAKGYAGWGRVGNALYGFVVVGAELNEEAQKACSELFLDMEARLNVMAAWLKYKRNGRVLVDVQAEMDTRCGWFSGGCPRD